MTKIQNKKDLAPLLVLQGLTSSFRKFEYSNLGFVSDFEFRASDFYKTPYKTDS